MASFLESLLHSHGNMSEGSRDFTPAFWLTASLANSTPPSEVLQVQCPPSARSEVIVSAVIGGYLDTFCFLGFCTITETWGKGSVLQFEVLVLFLFNASSWVVSQGRLSSSLEPLSLSPQIWIPQVPGLMPLSPWGISIWTRVELHTRDLWKIPFGKKWFLVLDKKFKNHSCIPFHLGCL